MSDSNGPPRDMSEEEFQFFSLFSLLKEEFHPLVDDFSVRMVRYVTHHHDDFRTQNPDLNEVVSSSLITTIASLFGLWDDADDSDRGQSPPPQQDEDLDESD